MKQELLISDVAELFNVPVSTLRYWEKKGLISFEREEGNHYRSATLGTIRNLCDITFYRNLSVPIEELKQLLQMDSEEIKRTLIKSRNALEQRITEMQQTISNIDIKLSQIDILQKLQEVPIQFVKETIPAVRSFELYRSSDLRNLANFERNLIVMIPYEKLTSHHYGVFVPDDYPKDQIIREKDAEPKLYLKVLLKTSYERIEENNLDVYYDYIKLQGYTPGLAMGKVLVSANDGELHNYYETWIEANQEEEAN